MNTWGLFFSWPSGGTWSNMIASFEWVVIAAAVVWVFRDHIGKHLTKWWHKHHSVHLQAEFEKMKLELIEHIKRGPQ